MRISTLTLAAALLVTPAGSSRSEDDLAAGLRQVREGDFEGAVVTLQAVVDRMGPSGPPKELAQAHLHLGIAHLALDRRDEAKARFRDALNHDPTLHLSPAAFSPKVLRLWAEVRDEQERLRHGAANPKRSGGSKVALVVGAAAAAGAGVALAVSGGGEPPAGSPTQLANARFATPIVECPDGSDNRLIAVTVLADLVNGGDGALLIQGTTLTLTIRASPALPSEVNFESTRPVRISADRAGPRSRVPLSLMTDLVCGNASGDPARHNEWLGRLTMSTSAGVFTVETADLLRVNIP